MPSPKSAFGTGCLENAGGQGRVEVRLQPDELAKLEMGEPGQSQASGMLSTRSRHRSNTMSGRLRRGRRLVPHRPGSRRSGVDEA